MPLRVAADLVVDLQRIVALLRTVIKYGADPLIRRVFRLRPRPPLVAIRLRLALEELGLLYLKMGQYLSTRFDVLPSDVCQELNKLLENVPPTPFSAAKTLIETELQAPLPSLFSDFRENPIASASVAQVYEAWTVGGDRVAVKVQRPNIERFFAADMRNLKRIAVLMDTLGMLGSLSMKEIVDTFESWTARELDFRLEGYTAERLGANAVKGEIIPRVYWSLTTRRVLTLEFIEGISLARVVELLEQGDTEAIGSSLPRLDVKLVGHLLATAFLHQCFVTGFFHGDPHPGNLIVRADNSVAFIDFGIFGELSEYQRDVLLGHIENIALGNIPLSFHYYAKQAIPSSETNERQFAREGTAILQRWYESSRDPFATADQRHLGRYSAEMFDTVRRNHVRISTSTLLFWRALNVLASTAARLPEHFDLLAEMKSFFYSTRQGLGPQLLDSLTVLEYLGTPLSLVSSARRSLETLDLLTLRGVGVSRIEESFDTEHSVTLATKCAAAAIIGLSLVVVSVSVINPRLRIAFNGIGIAFFLWAAAKVEWR